MGSTANPPLTASLRRMANKKAAIGSAIATSALLLLDIVTGNPLGHVLTGSSTEPQPHGTPVGQLDRHTQAADTEVCVQSVQEFPQQDGTTQKQGYFCELTVNGTTIQVESDTSIGPVMFGLDVTKDKITQDLVENDQGQPVIEYLLRQNGGIFEIGRFLPAARTISADGRVTYGIVELRSDFAAYWEGLQEQNGRKHAPILLSQNQVDANGQGVLVHVTPDTLRTGVGTIIATVG